MPTSASSPVPNSPVTAASPFADARVASLIRRIGRGDQRALEDLYDLTADDIYGYLKQIGGDDIRASSLLADVYVEVWSTAPRFTATADAPQTWLGEILLRRVRNNDRRRSA